MIETLLISDKSKSTRYGIILLSTIASFVLQVFSRIRGFLSRRYSSKNSRKVISTESEWAIKNSLSQFKASFFVANPHFFLVSFSPFQLVYANLQNQVPFFVSSLYALILHLFLSISAMAILFHKIPTIHFPSLYSVAEIYKFLIHLIDQLICSSPTYFQELLHFFCVHKYLVHIRPSFHSKMVQDSPFLS